MAYGAQFKAEYYSGRDSTQAVYLVDGLVPTQKLAIDANGIATFQAFIRSRTLSGNVFAATTGKLTSPTSGPIGASLFMPSAASKNLIVCSALSLSSASSQNWQINSQTADPLLGTPMTPVNMQGGGGASVASLSYTDAVVTATGNEFRHGTISGNQYFEFLPDPICFSVPAGIAGGITVYFTPTSAVVWSVDFLWAEYS